MKAVSDKIYKSTPNKTQEIFEAKPYQNKEYNTDKSHDLRSINVDLFNGSSMTDSELNAAETHLSTIENKAQPPAQNLGERLCPEGRTTSGKVKTAKTAKSVKSAGRRTAVACDQFLKDDKALRLAREAVAAGETIVIDRKTRGRKGFASSPFSLTPVSPTVIRVQIEPRSIAGTKKLKPLPFSRVTDRVRARFLYDALVSMGPVSFVTINLSDDIIAKAYRQPNFLDWVVRRIKRELKKALGRDVELYLMLEELCTDDLKRETIRPHLHGAMQINANEIDLARKALRKAAGEWKIGARQFQIRFESKHDFDSGNYMAKQSWKAAPRIRAFLARIGAARRYVLSFKGGVLTATKAVKEKAAELYARAAEDVLSARRGAFLIEAPGIRPGASQADRNPRYLTTSHFLYRHCSDASDTV